MHFGLFPFDGSLMDLGLEMLDLLNDALLVLHGCSG